MILGLLLLFLVTLYSPLDWLLDALPWVDTGSNYEALVDLDCSMDPNETWSEMTGRWYGQFKLDGGGLRMWIITREANGQYKTHFRTVKNGQEKNVVEVGVWGAACGHYLTTVTGRLVDGKWVPSDQHDPRFRNLYRIARFSSNMMVYQSLSSGIDYSAIKIPDDFDFPVL